MKPNKSELVTRREPLVIGLTGPIGAGKSEVARYLTGHFDVEAIDADKLGHEVLLQDSVKSALKDTFGNIIFDEKGEVIRAKLAEKAFASEEGTEKLNRITRPAIVELAKERVALVQAGVAILEAAELCKSDLLPLCKSVWVVMAPKETRLKRLIHNRAMSQEDALSRIEKQWSDAEYVAHANYVIDSGKSLWTLRREAKQAFKKEWEKWATGTAEA